MLSLLTFTSCSDEDAKDASASSIVQGQEILVAKSNYECDAFNNDCLDSVVLISSAAGFCQGIATSSNEVIFNNTCKATCDNLVVQNLDKQASKCAKLEDLYTDEDGNEYQKITLKKDILNPIQISELDQDKLKQLGSFIELDGDNFLQKSFDCTLTFSSIHYPKAASHRWALLNIKDCFQLPNGALLTTEGAFSGISYTKDIVTQLILATNQSCLTSVGECKNESNNSSHFVLNKLMQNLKRVDLNLAESINKIINVDNDYYTLGMPKIDIVENKIIVRPNLECLKRVPNFWKENVLEIDVKFNRQGELAYITNQKITKSIYVFSSIKNENKTQAQPTIIVPVKAQANVFNQKPMFSDEEFTTQTKVYLVKNPNLFVASDGEISTILSLQDENLSVFNKLEDSRLPTCN